MIWVYRDAADVRTYKVPGFFLSLLSRIMVCLTQTLDIVLEVPEQRLIPLMWRDVVYHCCGC